MNARREQRLKRLLKLYGWIRNNGDDVIKAIGDVKDFFGIETDDDVEAVLQQRRFCSHDHTQEFSGGVSKWGKTGLTYSLAVEMEITVSDQKVFSQFQLATNEIMRVCGLTFDYETSFRQADIQIHIGSNMGGNSGPGGVLADSNLPPTNPVIQRYDRGEKWSTSPDKGIWLYLVALHELLHAVGLPHVSPRAAKAVINPIYDPSLSELQDYDVSELRRRYGGASRRPPATPDDDRDSVDIDGAKQIIIEGAKKITIIR